MHPLIFTHILGAVVGLLSGYMAVIFRKGSGLHNAAGTVFFASMLTMASSAAYIATVLRPHTANRLVSLLTLYLVTTAWFAARRRGEGMRLYDRLAFLFILGVGLMTIASGFQARRDKPLYFVFGIIMLLCALTDFRMLLRGTLNNQQRLVRHLWRMCVALLLATLSLYPGQAKLFPPSMRGTIVVFLPHIFLIGSMIYWRFRMSRKRARQQQQPVIAVAPV